MFDLKDMPIKGNWATLLLPILENESIDFSMLRDEIDHFVAARVSGVYSNGSAGEFYAQDEDEFDCINYELAERCRAGGIPFQIGVSHSSAQGALKRLVRAKALGPIAIQVTLPDWFPPTFEESSAFLERMAEAAEPIPLIVYNPPHAKRRFTPDEWIRVARTIPGVAGMKVPAVDDAWYRAMEPVLKVQSVFIPGHFIDEGLARGARGTYSNVACLSPSGAQRWYELCVRDPQAGRRLGIRVRAFWHAHIAPIITQDGLSNMAADKAAAVAGGWLPGLSPRLRWPYRSVASDAAKNIGLIARAEIPEFFY